jgi:shikimate dehydrogenase
VRLAVIGDPVAHSRSPRIYERFLEEARVDGSYAAIRTPRGSAGETIRRLRLEGYTGCNVTFPLKEEALAACDTVDEEIKRIGAVNTIVFGRGTAAANTDGIGARTALETLLDEPLALKRVGVLGYGATARAILAQLQDNDVYAFVWGRDPAKVAEVCVAFESAPLDPRNPPEIIVSTLPPKVELPEELISALQGADVIMDANYGERSTLGRALRRDVIPGDAMLEAQARASFDIWLAYATVA